MEDGNESVTELNEDENEFAFERGRIQKLFGSEQLARSQVPVDGFVHRTLPVLSQIRANGGRGKVDRKRLS